MTVGASDDAAAARFEAARPRLGAIAYRMLGSIDDAQDAVQEAWLRLNRSSAEGIANLDAWLTTKTMNPGDYGLAAAFGPGFSAELLLLQWP